MKYLPINALILLVAIQLTSCAESQSNTPIMSTENENQPIASQGTDTATFGAGCFWCVEAVFQELEGVATVESGYAGGFSPNPTYEEVCSGKTGHAEVCQITYDPAKITYDELLEVFWQTHDPTTLNRQGGDKGTQYRSAVFSHSDEQQKSAEFYKKKLSESGAWNNPIVTEISPITNYTKAENNHQDYFTNNSSQPYCAFVIQPKVDKFRKAFAEKLKK